MAYDPATGLWKNESDSIAQGVTGLLETNSPYMRAAKTQGMRFANSRGLLNSSIATGAVTDAAIKSALPIASQDASQANAKNLSAQGFVQTGGLQKQQIDAQKESQTQAEAATASNLAKNIEAQKQSQTQAEQATSTNLGSQIASQEKQQKLSIESQQTIASMNVAANDKEKVAATMASIEGTYSQAFSQVANNENIPAATRDIYLQSLAGVRNDNLKLLEQIYNVDLDWTTPTSTPNATPIAASSTTGVSKVLQEAGVNPSTIIAASGAQTPAQLQRTLEAAGVPQVTINDAINEAKRREAIDQGPTTDGGYGGGNNGGGGEG